MGNSSNSRTPRVLYLIDSMHGGGAERQAVELLQALQPKCDLCLGLLNERGPLLDDVPEELDIVNLEGCAGWRRAIHGGQRLRRVVDAFHPDIVISSLIESNRLLARTSPFLPGSPETVLTVQNNLSLNMSKRSMLSSLLDKVEVPVLYNLADRIVAVSDGVKQSLVEQYAIPAHRITVIHNMVNLDRVQKEVGRDVPLPWDPEADVPTLIAVGRMVPQKALDELVQAFSLLRRQRRARLILLGDGPLYSHLKAQVDDLGLGDALYMPGFVDNPWAYMHRSDIFVSSSHWEGFSLAHLEAMACGCVPVLTDCNFGPRELIEDGVNGRLAPVGDPESMAAIVGALLDDPEQCRRLADTAQSYVQRYDRPAIVRQYQDLINELIGRTDERLRSA